MGFLRLFLVLGLVESFFLGERGRLGFCREGAIFRFFFFIDGFFC